MAWLRRPTSGVWNLGGGPDNAMSVRLALDRVESLTGQKIEVVPAAGRPGDIHTLIVRSDRFRRDFPDCMPPTQLNDIFNELAGG